MNKINKIIQIIRENMIANMPGKSGAYTSAGDPMSFGGFDKLIDGRSSIRRRLPKPYSQFLNKNKKR